MILFHVIVPANGITFSDTNWSVEVQLGNQALFVVYECWCHTYSTCYTEQIKKGSMCWSGGCIVFNSLAVMSPEYKSCAV